MGGGVTTGGFGLDVDGTRVELDYSDPEMIFTLSKQASDKTFLRNNGVLTHIEFDLPPADGQPVSGLNPVVAYTIAFNRDANGVLESQVITADSAPTEEVARKTFNRNSDGSISSTVIS